MNQPNPHKKLYAAAFLEWNGRQWQDAVHYIGGADSQANATASFWQVYRGKPVKLCAVGLAVGAQVAEKPLIQL